tara:strand:+ start:581 stop:1420 length:840 start_codon:yes stop_codon:yes gene_type:complete
MPKKQNNTHQLVEIFIKENENTISENTQNTYLNVGKNIPFNILTTQTTVIKKLNDFVENPNTMALYLNVIILIRRHNKEETDKLVKFRNQLKDKIISLRKEKLGDMKNTLPKKDELVVKLNEMTGIRYIINYIFLNYGLRNKDINLKMVNKTPDDKENYLILTPRKVELIINDYKTDESFGQKKIVVIDKKFIKELKSLNLKNDDYLLSKKDGSKLKISTFNERVKNLSIDKLGETTIFKVIIKQLLEDKNFSEIEKLVKTRGTSLSTIMKSYNVFNST